MKLSARLQFDKGNLMDVSTQETSNPMEVVKWKFHNSGLLKEHLIDLSENVTMDEAEDYLVAMAHKFSFKLDVKFQGKLDLM